MFTGIIDHTGTVKSIENNVEKFRITIETEFSDLIIGESIAIDGACLTVTEINKEFFCVDVSPETLRLTRVGCYHTGSKINLERSMRLIDRLGGHFVTGHVDQQCRVAHITQFNEFIEMTFEDVEVHNQSYLINKGSIAVNGVSLTLNEVNANRFKVMLIPHTLEKTNLSLVKTGEHVNVEFDYLAKIVLNQTKVAQYET